MKFSKNYHDTDDSMAEWLRRQIRNLMGSARGGSNPPAVVSCSTTVTAMPGWPSGLRRQT